MLDDNNKRLRGGLRLQIWAKPLGSGIHYAEGEGAYLSGVATNPKADCAESEVHLSHVQWYSPIMFDTVDRLTNLIHCNVIVAVHPVPM